jgi:hypothetical protein
VDHQDPVLVHTGPELRQRLLIEGLTQRDRAGHLAYKHLTKLTERNLHRDDLPAKMPQP